MLPDHTYSAVISFVLAVSSAFPDHIHASITGLILALNSRCCLLILMLRSGGGNSSVVRAPDFVRLNNAMAASVGCFDVRTDVDAYDCTWGLYEHCKRVCK